MPTRSTRIRSLRALACAGVLAGLLAATGPPTASAVTTPLDDKVEPGLLNQPDGQESSSG